MLGSCKKISLNDNYLQEPDCIRTLHCLYHKNYSSLGSEIFTQHGKSTKL